MVQGSKALPKDIVLQQKTDSCYNAPTSENIALIEIINKMLEEEVLATAFKKESLSRKWRANRSGSIRIPKHRISLPVSKTF